ncbi:MAG: hypothetical protein KC609_17830, partial [Myxococcales bacterium]|nr:hypothetical protein [Myxococcales bacterium]
MPKLVVAIAGLLVTFFGSASARQTIVPTKRPLLSSEEVALRDQLERQMRKLGRLALLDLRLVRAARIYTRALAEIDRLPSGFIHENFLHHALNTAGLADPHPVTIEIALERLEHPRTAKLLQSVLARWTPTHYGLALAEKPTTKGHLRKRFTVIFVARHCQIRVPNRPLRKNAAITVEGELDPSWQLPRLYVMTPAGRVHHYVMTRRFRRIWSPSLRLRKEGRYLFEIMATNRRGPSVLALYPVHVGETTPQLVRYPVLEPALKKPTSSAAEALIVKLINLDRRRQGLPSLIVHGGLRRVAREHSRDMLEQRYFAHNSPRRGSLRSRLEQAGIRFT